LNEYYCIILGAIEMSAETIQIDYLALQRIAGQFAQDAEQVYISQDRLITAFENLQKANWMGQGANMFFREFEEELMPALIRLAENLGESRLAVLEVCRIFSEAEELAAKGFEQEVMDPLSRRPLTLTEIRAKWSEFSDQAKEQVLKRINQEMAKEFGFPPVDIYFADLPDKKGDVIGEHIYQKTSSGQLSQGEGEEFIILDIKNIRSDNVDKILGYLAHENRHVIQQYYMDHPESSPAGISEEQVDNWKQRYINPGNTVGQTSDPYRNQPREKDAYQFQEDYMRNFDYNQLFSE
jgi:WXG100 family type VII secretion target